MTPTDVTPASVLFDLMKRECGVSHKELAGMLLSGRPLSDGRSPLSRMDDRTWVSRTVVHAAPASLADRYFCDYSVGALRLAARMKAREKKALPSEKILAIVAGRPGEAMDRALEAHGEDPTLFRNMMERIKGEAVMTADEKAEVALVLLVTVACTSDVRRAVKEAQSFAKSVFGRGVRTPAPALAVAGDGASGAALDQKELWLGLLRVEDGYLSGTPQWIAPTEDGTEIGSLALAEGAVNEVGPDVSARARAFSDYFGAAAPPPLAPGASAILSPMAYFSETASNNAPIGIFDSGLGGFTVAREIVAALPHESIVYAGDTARCPYGPRDQREVDAFVQQICSWLVSRGVKMIVIACNTATAAGLAHAQRTMPVPVVGVVEPGARAAVMTTRTRRVGVVATQGTIDSGAYERAITNIDAGIQVLSAPTQRFVEIAEQGLRGEEVRFSGYDQLVAAGFDRPEYHAVAEGYLAPFRQAHVDTLVLGCTHFPLLAGLIGQTLGPEVQLISSATETARDVAEILRRRRAFANEGHRPTYQFYTSGSDCEEFAHLGALVMGVSPQCAETADFGELHPPELTTAKENIVEKKVVIATNNAHKVSEITTALDFAGWQYSTLRDAGLVSNPVEDADSFEGNARIKARAAHELSGGLAALADDSGLVVDALDGAPGVFSSRYAGEDGNDAANNEKLLRELADLPFEQRTARFVCTLVFIDEDGSETVARGTIEGKIGFEEKGSGGFGYDPLFYPDFYDGKLTLAEVPQADKNAISHRGNALRQLKALLEAK